MDRHWDSGLGALECKVLKDGNKVYCVFTNRQCI